MSPAVILIAIVAVVLVWLWFTYNSLVKARLNSDEAWSDINVQLKRRYDLIPNLVNSVKGYATHESKVFEQVTEARSAAMGATGVGQKAVAENQLADALKSLFAVAEAYPDLKANENFKHLQEELVDSEDKIQAARRFYNGVVRDFNTKRTIFPTNIFAGLLGFKQDKEYFEVDEAEAAAVSQPVDVKF